MKILYIDCFFGFDAAMLLGALIDAGADADAIAAELGQHVKNPAIEVSDTTRMSIECKKARVLCTDKGDCAPYAITRKYGETCGTDDATMQAVLCALETMDIEYVMCSHMTLPDSADGEVISILQNAGIELLPMTDDMSAPGRADAAFLTFVATESGPKPDMDIISIGYGAGGTDTDLPCLVTATIGMFNPEGLYLSHEEDIAQLL